MKSVKGHAGLGQTTIPNGSVNDTPRGTQASVKQTLKPFPNQTPTSDRHRIGINDSNKKTSAHSCPRPSSGPHSSPDACSCPGYCSSSRRHDTSSCSCLCLCCPCHGDYPVHGPCCLYRDCYPLVAGMLHQRSEQHRRASRQDLWWMYS